MADETFFLLHNQTPRRIFVMSHKAGICKIDGTVSLLITRCTVSLNVVAVVIFFDFLIHHEISSPFSPD